MPVRSEQLTGGLLAGDTRALMTIAAAYLTSEGVVLAADSATTITTVNTPAGQLFNHAQKVFEVGRGGRLGICTWGPGMVGTLSHRTIAARLGDVVDATPLSVREAADRLASMVQVELAKAGAAEGPGYMIGGHGADRIPECYTLTCKDSKMSVAPIAVGDAVFGGNPQYFQRVFQGFAPSIPAALLSELRARMANLPPNFDQHYADAFAAATKPLGDSGIGDLPIREAIDYLHACLHITIKAFKFMPGPPSCGGPIEIGFITTDRAFRWASHKSFDAGAGDRAT